MAVEETLVAPGTQVFYQGSLSEKHGWAVVTDVRTDGYVFADGTGGTRYTLRYGQHYTQFLFNVRRQSFTTEDGT